MNKDSRGKTQDIRPKTIVFGLWFLVFALFLAGCAQQQFTAVEQICASGTNKSKTMQAAEGILGQMHFVIDKSDAEQGIIRTRPLAGAQFFEFWRSDNVGGFNAAEANLHSIRRIAELKISQQDKQLCIGCNVKTQRLNLPAHQVSSISQTHQMFTKSGSSTQRLRLYPDQKRDMVWVDLGRDARLETEILKRIENKLKN